MNPIGSVASAYNTLTTGGTVGQAAIVIVPDDNHDGVGDPHLIYRNGLPSTQGMLFANGSFYFQDHTTVRQEPYVAGQRTPGPDAGVIADVQVFVDALHWPKTLDLADDGTIYLSNGGDQNESCDSNRPFRGGILALDPTQDGGVREIAMGTRNPIFVRCHRDGNNRCFAAELALDFSGDAGGREKLIPIRAGDDWGFPCCGSGGVAYQTVCLTCSAQTATRAASTPYCQALNSTVCSPDCSATAVESNSFTIGSTPFGFTFVDTQFPPPWDHQLFEAMHGDRRAFSGSGVVAIAFDPVTGALLPSSNLPGLDAGALRSFLGGWDDGTLTHGRPSDVEISPDGRLFVANDTTGEIFWVSPLP